MKEWEVPSMYYPEAHFLNYGLGWFLSDYRGRKVVEHGGAIDGMRAQVALIPEEKLGLVVLSNMNGSALPVALMYRILILFSAHRDRGLQSGVRAGVGRYRKRGHADFISAALAPPRIRTGMVLLTASISVRAGMLSRRRRA